jgi:cellulose synthase/poly-beta-1,6-N-acetylglucosamine synthase-like glycosyltransferase
MQVISGAVGAFRKDVLLKIGGYSKDTIVEDMDVTIELAKRGHKVIYNPHAIAYTEAPESVRDFLKQRYRWTYGGFQVIAKHRDELFRRHRLGTIGLPYFAIFPWFDVVVSCILLSAIARAVLLRDPLGLVLFYLVMCGLQMVLTLFALIVDKEDKRLVRLVALDSLFYTHLISYTTVRAGINYLLRRKTTWNKLQRQGKNVLQPLPSASD